MKASATSSAPGVTGDAVGTVLVVGASGALGQPAVRLLRERGVTVRALCRHAALYAREAGLPPRASHLPAGVARAMSTLAAPLHPGMARILRLMSLPDDAFSEHFDGADALEQRFGVRLTRLEAFVRERVRAHRQAA